MFNNKTLIYIQDKECDSLGLSTKVQEHKQNLENTQLLNKIIKQRY